MTATMTTVDCDKITNRPPVAVSRQQQAPEFDADNIRWHMLGGLRSQHVMAKHLPVKHVGL